MLIVVQVAQKATAESAVSQLDPSSAGTTFVIDLSSTGQEPITHVACQPNVPASLVPHVQAIASRFSGASVFAATSAEDHLPMIARSLQSIGLMKVERE